MSAVLGLDATVIEEVLNGREGVSIANYNCPGQIVITGDRQKAVAEGRNSALKEAGARRVLPLKVSGPFPFTDDETGGGRTGEGFCRSQHESSESCRMWRTSTQRSLPTAVKIEELLVAQVSGSVRWQQSVETMIREGVDTFVEIGPGKTLTGFLRKIDKNVKSYHIGSWEEAVQVCEELK